MIDHSLHQIPPHVRKSAGAVIENMFAQLWVDYDEYDEDGWTFCIFGPKWPGAKHEIHITRYGYDYGTIELTDELREFFQ